MSRQVQGERVVGAAAGVFRAPLCARLTRDAVLSGPLFILERLNLALPSGSAEAQVMAAQIRDGSGAHQLHITY